MIKFLSNEGTTAVEIESRLLQASHEDAYTVSCVYECIRAFKTARTRVLTRIAPDNRYSTTSIRKFSCCFSQMSFVEFARVPRSCLGMIFTDRRTQGREGQNINRDAGDSATAGAIEFFKEYHGG
jgi:hypothetical protein